MSSVEIVDVINAMRGPGKAELLHKNFTAKVEGLPGIDALNFQHTYFDQLGRVQTCYYLPKREAELMVMSEVFDAKGESLEVQQPSNSTTSTTSNTSNTNNPFPGNSAVSFNGTYFDSAPTKGEVMTPAQKFIASKYEQGVDAQLDVDSLRGFLLTQGIKPTPAQILNDLESVYGFHEYSSRHPAPTKVCTATMYRMIDRMTDR